MAARERGPIGRAACLAARSMVGSASGAFGSLDRSSCGMGAHSRARRYGGSPGARESGNRTGRRQCRDGQFARRRESQYLLATGGYTEQWR
jgi:hypothetical protein